MRSDLTQDRLMELLSYDARDGLFHWRIARGAVKPGDSAGYLSGSRGGGYVVIRLDGVLYAAHRLAWLYSYGTWPEHCIDHIDGDGRNNRLANLRDVPNAINRQNMRKARSDSKSGVIGASWHKAAQKWRARIRLCGQETHLGLFDTMEEAREAYVQAKRALHLGGRL